MAGPHHGWVQEFNPPKQYRLGSHSDHISSSGPPAGAGAGISYSYIYPPPPPPRPPPPSGAATAAYPLHEDEFRLPGLVSATTAAAWLLPPPPPPPPPPLPLLPPLLPSFSPFSSHASTNIFLPSSSSAAASNRNTPLYSTTITTWGGQSSSSSVDQPSPAPRTKQMDIKSLLNDVPSEPAPPPPIIPPNPPNPPLPPPSKSQHPSISPLAVPGSSRQLRPASFSFSSPLRPAPRPGLSSPGPDADTATSEYRIWVRQQPQAARACGFGERDRRVIDPPPIVQLHIDGLETDRPVTGDQLASLQARFQFTVLHCSIWNAAGDQDNSTMPDEYRQPRRLTGMLVSNPFFGQDEHGHEGCFFCFPDLSCRTPGSYRLRFSLVVIDPQTDMCKGGSLPIRAFATSEIFMVYSAKDFPGMQASTPLIRRLREQGCLISIKKGNTHGRSEPDSGNEDNDDDNGSARDDRNENNDNNNSNDNGEAAVEAAAVQPQPARPRRRLRKRRRA